MVPKEGRVCVALGDVVLQADGLELFVLAGQVRVLCPRCWFSR